MKLLLLWFLVYCTIPVISIKCGSDISNWDDRAKALGCKTRGLEYHCVLDDYGKVKELCLQKSFVAAGFYGCPWYLLDGKQTTRGSPFTYCPNTVKGCPEIDHKGYYMDSLYVYPLCLVSEKERNKTIAGMLNGSYQLPVDTLLSRKGECYAQNHAAIAILSSIVALSLCANIVFIVISRKKLLTTYRKWKRSEKNRTDESESLLKEKTQDRQDPLLQERKQADDILIIETNVMKNLQKHMESNPVAVLIGEEGSGKTTVVTWYMRVLGQHSPFNGIFECMNYENLSKSLHKWNKTICEEELQHSDSCVDICSEQNEALLAKDFRNSLKKIPEGEQVVLVFENISDECKDIVERLVKICLQNSSEIGCLLTCSKQVIKEAWAIFSINGLTLHDAATLLSQGICNISEESALTNETTKHGKILQNLGECPLTLHCARNYLRNSFITPDKAIHYFALLFGEIRGKTAQDRNTAFLIQLLKQTHPFVYNILEAIRYLPQENIPIAIFQYLDVEENVHGILQAEGFIQVMRQFFLIQVHGKDDDRSITILKSINHYFKRKSTNSDKDKTTLMNSVCLFTWLFDRQSRSPITPERFRRLIPMAMEVIKVCHAAEPKLWSVLDKLLILFMCAKVTRVCSNLKLSDEEGEVSRTLLLFLRLFEFGEEKSKPYKRAKELLQQNSEDLKEAGLKYARKTIRTCDTMQSVRKHFPHSSKEYQLGSRNFKCLQDKGKILPEEHIGLWFLYRILIETYLALGLKSTVVYDDDKSEPDYIALACELANDLKIKKEIQNISAPLYCVLDLTINGTVERHLQDSTKHKKEHVTEAQKQEIQKLMEDVKKRGYYTDCVLVEGDRKMGINEETEKQLNRLKKIEEENKKQTLGN